MIGLFCSITSKVVRNNYYRIIIILLGKLALIDSIRISMFIPFDGG